MQINPAIIWDSWMMEATNLKKKYPNISLTSCALKNSDDSCVTRMAFSRLMYLDCENKHINVLLSIQAIGLVYSIYSLHLSSTFISRYNLFVKDNHRPSLRRNV